MTNLVAGAVTTEVVMVYQALSFHSTDQLGDSGILKEPIQADVLPVPMALSGAFPEVLAEAIAKPHKLASIGSYSEKEANLAVLSHISLSASQENETFLVSIDVSQYQSSEEVEPGPRETVTLLIAAVKKTFQQWGAVQPEQMRVSVKIIGMKPENSFLKELNTHFTVGGKS